jgi:hypothetical protein
VTTRARSSRARVVPARGVDAKQQAVSVNVVCNRSHSVRELGCVGHQSASCGVALRGLPAVVNVHVRVPLGGAAPHGAGRTRMQSHARELVCISRVMSLVTCCMAQL